MNWDKTFAVWASKNARSFSWGADKGITWVVEGTGVRYLGSLVGFHLPLDTNTTPLLTSIKKKLRSWAVKTVSQAGRVVIINQVFLTTCWYMAACCGLSKKTCDILRGLMIHYLWTGKDEGKCATRMKWNACLLPHMEGGINLIDPYLQTQALLTKLMVRGLAPGNESWKKLMRHRIASGRPLGEARWSASPTGFSSARGSRE